MAKEINEVLGIMQEESDFYLQKANAETCDMGKYSCLANHYAILSGRYSWQCPVIIDDCWNSYCNTNKEDLLKKLEDAKGIAIFSIHN